MSKFSQRIPGKVRLLLLSLAVLQAAGCSSAEQRAQSYYESGMKFLAAHEYAKAAIEFRNAVEKKRDLVPAWRGLAQVDEATHQWQALVPVLKTIITLDPKDVDTKLKLGRLLLAGGAADQASKLVNEINDQDGNASVLAVKAAIAYKLKNTAEAVQDAQAALKIDPANLEAAMILAVDRLANGDPKAALEIVRSQQSGHADDLGLKLLEIQVDEKLGDTASVERLLRALTELYPKDVNFRKQLVRFYIAQHRMNDAENELRNIAKADPKSIDAELDLVRFLAAAKGPTVARQELVDRIGAGGDVFSFQLALADFDYAQGNFADSSKLLETLANDKDAPEHALTAKIKLANMNLARKNVDAAETIVNAILAKDNRNTDALELRATIRIDRGQFEPAIADLREALNAQPRSTELMLRLATAYDRSGAVELAEKEFADATRASNYDPRVGLNYVAFLRRRGSTERAEDVMNDLANRNPKSVPVLSALAEIKLERQDWTGAEQIAATIRKLGDRNGVADEILGLALGGQNKYDDSIAAFRNAVAAAPLADRPIALLVREYIAAKQTNKAADFLQAILKENPANAEALVLLGTVSLANNAPDEAKKNFTAAIDKQPKDVVGYRALADFYLRQKNADAALKVIRSGLNQMPDNFVLHIMLAGLLEQNEDYAGAITEYEYLLKQQPGSVIASNNLASILADHRTDQASLDRAKSLAITLRKYQMPQFKDTIGWISYRTGDFKEAVPLLEQAATAMPNAALVHYHLGMSYEATGQSAKAAEEFKTALTKSPSNALAETIRAELRKTTTQ